VYHTTCSGPSPLVVHVVHSAIDDPAGPCSACAAIEDPAGPCSARAAIDDPAGPCSAYPYAAIDDPAGPCSACAAIEDPAGVQACPDCSADAATDVRRKRRQELAHGRAPVFVLQYSTSTSRHGHFLVSLWYRVQTIAYSYRLRCRWTDTLTVLGRTAFEICRGPRPCAVHHAVWLL
jgi:hypothetical protein